jgi:hypothetical protein
MQINLTGFLNGKHARIFMGELWQMLDSAQKNESGIPQELLDLKVRLSAGLRIRIPIGSGFNEVSGSGSVFGIRIRIQGIRSRSSSVSFYQ